MKQFLFVSLALLMQGASVGIWIGTAVQLMRLVHGAEMSTNQVAGLGLLLGVCWLGPQLSGIVMAWYQGAQNATAQRPSGQIH